MSAQIVWERPQNCRRKWYRVFAKYINGVTEEVARFTHLGDVHLYVNSHFLHEGVNTVEKITIQ